MLRCLLLRTHRVAGSLSIKHSEGIHHYPSSLCAARWYGYYLRGLKLVHPIARSRETGCCHSVLESNPSLYYCSSILDASSQRDFRSHCESGPSESDETTEFTGDVCPKCSGCGSILQAESPTKAGFVPLSKIQELKDELKQQAEVECKHSKEEMDSSSNKELPEQDNQKTPPSSVVCKRCFSLKHYNSALNITLKANDYLRHLAHLRDKRALIILMVDISDFPGSLFPQLNTLISPSHQVMIVANKIDLLPAGLLQGFHGLESMIVKECLGSSLVGCKITKVHFISAKTGVGVENLANSVINYWGNRGDVYLLGCTNVGKSSLFNRLLVSLCGAIPGRLNVDSNVTAPTATISQWPGTTLGLLSFPIISGGKRRRLLAQAQREALLEVEKGERHFPSGLKRSGQEHSQGLAFSEEDIVQAQVRKLARGAVNLDAEDALTEVGLRKTPLTPPDSQSVSLPMNRFWLHDTPGAINDAQLINLLTTKELKLALPKKALKPRTFILKPGQCMLIGGLARIDYTEGPTSAYFTVFAASYLPVHTTSTIRADDLYTRNLGTHLLKIPCGDKERLDQFPKLEPLELSITGCGWNTSAADVILSSAGWVAVTMGHEKGVCLKAYTPNGNGVFLRTPALFSTAVMMRGRRSKKGNRTSFL